MKVEYLQSMAGPNLVIKVGDVRKVDNDEAKRLISAGIAKPLRSSSKEKAVLD